MQQKAIKKSPRPLSSQENGICVLPPPEINHFYHVTAVPWVSGDFQSISSCQCIVVGIEALTSIPGVKLGDQEYTEHTQERPGVVSTPWA